MRMARTRLGEARVHVNCVGGEDAKISDVALQLRELVRVQYRSDGDSVAIGAILHADDFQSDHLE